MSESNSTTKILCRVDGCGRGVHYQEAQLCQMHYFRVWRNGTTDIVRKSAKPRIEDGRGYQFLHAPSHPLLARGQIYVAEHRIVLFAVLGPGPMSCELCGVGLSWKTCHVDHIDENPRNNDRSNLRPLCMRCNTWRSMPPAVVRMQGVLAITFDGITQTATEWARDPRVNITGATIKRRKLSGASDFEALFGEKITHNGNPYVDRRPKKTSAKHERSNAVAIEIDGETMTAAEWSRHPDCEVSANGIVWRIRQGWSGKEAVFRKCRAIKAKHTARANELRKAMQ